VPPCQNPERVARALCRLQGHPCDIRFEGKSMWQSFLPEADAALAAADIDPLIALLRQIEAHAAVPGALRDQAAAVLREYAAGRRASVPRPRRPVPRRTLRAQTCDDRSRLPRSSASLLVPYFKIAPGTCCPPDERLPAEECQDLPYCLCVVAPGGFLRS